MKSRLSRIIRLALFVPVFAGSVQAEPTAADLLKIKWVNVPKNPPERVSHGTFHSECMDRPVGFNIYLPPGYEADSSVRFPVVYFLHGSIGNESRSIQLSTCLHKAILAGKAPPMIMVFANGGSNSNYIDSIDGTVLAETLIIQELIPHIDGAYRTIGQRSGRAIQGFSMGGGGALRIAAKFPDLFSSVVVYGAGGVREFDHMPTAEEIQDVKKAKRKLALKRAVMGNDLAYWQETGSWYLLEKNRDQIAGLLPIRIVIGTEDFSLEGAQTAQSRLAHLKIAYEFELVQDVDHDIHKLYEHSGLESLLFHASHFGGVE